MENPIVSIIVPCYNYGHFLAKTLASIKAQTFQNWECIIVDDGSTDNTKEVANGYIVNDNRFVYYYQPNKGLSNARNTGLKLAKGKFIQLLDADDLIEPDKLKNQSDFLVQNPQTDLVFGYSLFFIKTSDNNISYFPCPNPFRQEKYSNEIVANFLNHLLIQNRIPVCAPLLRAKIIHTIKNFDETLTSCEDWDFWLRIAHKSFVFSFLDTTLSKALVRQHSVSMRSNTWRMFYNELIVRKKTETLGLTKHQSKINNTQINQLIKNLLYEIVLNTKVMALVIKFKIALPMS